MTTKKGFLKQFFKEHKVVGAMSPSSKFLGEKMLKNVDFENSDLLVELGPGTGVFTELIINRLKPNSKLLVFELNDHFYSNLKKKINDDRVTLIHDSAENIAKYLAENEIGKIDAIISSLPLAIFDADLRSSVLEKSYDVLKQDGTFVQFQYSLQAKSLLKDKFSNVDIQFSLMNFPPAFVYNCKK